METLAITGARSFFHRAVDQRRHLFAIVLADLAGPGGHRDHHELLLRIDPEDRAVGAVPAEVPDGAVRRGDARLGSHRHAETEPVTRAARFGTRDVVLDVLAEVIGGHQAHRLRTQHTLAIDDAAVQEHLAEADVVRRRAERAAAAAFELRLLAK